MELLEQTHLEKAVVRNLKAEKKRRLSFSAVKNFRDLGGYQTLDGRIVRFYIKSSTFVQTMKRKKNLIVFLQI